MNDLQDSIRTTQKGHRKPDVAGAIADRIREMATPTAVAEINDNSDGELPPKKAARVVDQLPLSPQRTAKLGLTSILPVMKVRREASFRQFILEVAEPDFKTRFPTWQRLADHYAVSIPTIRAWLLSEEVGKAVRVSVVHEAAMAMPSVMRSVRLRAEITGDPHAAEWIRKVAKMGTAETDQAASFERTLKQIAAERRATPGLAAPAKHLKAAKVIDVVPLEGPDPLD